MEKLYSSKTFLKSGWWGDAYPTFPPLPHPPWIRPCSYLAKTSWHTVQQAGVLSNGCFLRTGRTEQFISLPNSTQTHC